VGGGGKPRRFDFDLPLFSKSSGGPTKHHILRNDSLPLLLAPVGQQQLDCYTAARTRCNPSAASLPQHPVHKNGNRQFASSPQHATMARTRNRNKGSQKDIDTSSDNMSNRSFVTPEGVRISEIPPSLPEYGSKPTGRTLLDLIGTVSDGGDVGCR
jgi:hypothetical protein